MCLTRNKRYDRLGMQGANISSQTLIKGKEGNRMEMVMGQTASCSGTRDPPGYHSAIPMRLAVIKAGSYTLAK